jgi:hypothetical protein
MLREEAPLPLSAKEKRVLNPNPYRHYRRTYRTAEVRAGMGVLAVLGLVTWWVVWKGAHPDPALFSSLVPKDATTTAGRGGAPRASGPASIAGAAPASAAPVPTLPANLAASGWSAGKPTFFDASNLYEKIDGRAEYFLSRGFKSLAFVSLTKDGAPATTVDVELYDLTSSDNAFSAFNGEKPADVKAKERSDTLWYTSPNALFLTRGGFYARAIGSDQGPEVKIALVQLTKALSAGLASSERPFAQKLFEEALGVAPDKISFLAENAFSFGFASRVHTAQLPDESDAFLVATRSPADAAALAARFEKGFLDYGEKVTEGGVTWVKDRYLAAFSRVLAQGPLVVGVRAAPSVAAGAATLAKLGKAATALPSNIVLRAAATAPEGPSAAAPEKRGGPP